MPAVKEKKLPKGEKAKISSRKPPPTSKAIPDFKSAEFVEDSDDEEHPPLIRIAQPQSSENSTVTSSEHYVPSTSSNASAQENIKLSSSNRSSESETSYSPHRANGITNGSLEDNGLESSSETSHESPPPTRPKSAPKPPAPANSILKPSRTKRRSSTDIVLNRSPVQQSGEGGSDEENTTGNNDKGKGQESTSGMEAEDDEMNENIEAHASTAPNQTPFPAYEPPSGFELATISFTPDSRVDEVFTPSNLEGKQIWHLTVPASLPISSIKALSWQSIASGSSIVTYGEADYVLVPDAEDASATPKTLLVPHLHGNEYKPAKVTIADTMHLQQLIQLPAPIVSSRNVPNGVSSPMDGSSKPRNKQPSGLKMRYHAFGVSGSSASESEIDPWDSECAEKGQRPQFQHPERSRVSSSPKKRKHGEINGAAPEIQGSPSKLKKRKHQPTISTNRADSGIDVDYLTASVVSRAKGERDEEVSQAFSRTTASRGKESKEEKAKRKAEKHKARLLEPSRVPRSASPVEPLTDGKLMHAEHIDLTGDDEVNNDNQVTAGAVPREHEARVLTAGELGEDDAAQLTVLGSSSPTKNDAMSVGSPSIGHQETQEERRKRKEEKRKRREEKKRRKEARLAGIES
ncbi:MAG: hypothetical protein Q9217_003283 [Psora testacea]